MGHFTEQRHPEYESRVDRWKYAWKHYTGMYADDDNIDDFLHQKKQRETQQAYVERKDVSDIILHFSTAIDGLCGIMFDKEQNAKREWGELGDPQEPDSVAYQLVHSADGEGTNWVPLFKQVAIRLTVMHRMWGLVEGVERDESGNVRKQGHLKLINPQSVVNWYPSVGMPEQVLVKESRDVRSSIKDTGDMEADIYTLYELDGWTRYKVPKKDTEGGVEQINTGSYAYYASPDREQRILPIFSVDIPMPRDVGYLLAKKQNYLFNAKSVRDFAVRNMSFAVLRLVATQDQYQELISELDKGYNILRQEPDAEGEHGFMSPDSSYLSQAGEILEKDVKDFYQNAFKEYGDSARQATATEIRLESKSGIEAFLSLLVSSLDEFERATMWRMEQVYFPDRPGSWGQASVRRTRNFEPEDLQERIDSMVERYVGGQVPLDSDTAADVVAKILETDGHTIDDEAKERIRETIEDSVDTDLAQAVARLVGKGMSTEQAVRTLHPNWEDSKVQSEVQRINEQKGAVEVPDNMIGG